MKKLALLFSLILTVTLFGCASSQNEKSDGSEWQRDVMIEFQRDTTITQKDAFYAKYRLEFLAQYDNDTVKCRILTGETVDDFIERLKDNPKVNKIEVAK